MINKFFNFMGLHLMSSKQTKMLYESKNKYHDSKRQIKSYNRLIKLAKELHLKSDKILQILSLVDTHCVQSQLLQDVAALVISDFKENGYFVEFGAADGIHHSNTYLLEKKYGWNGILAEPNRSYFKALNENRQAIISAKCVYESNNLLLDFVEAEQLSTLTKYVNEDFMQETRKRNIKKRYKVETITLEDLLISCGAPKEIDFISIDTEGSELEILKNFPFENYSFGFICVEHNFSKNREKINCLLENKGYERICEAISEMDDWFVKNTNQ